MTFETDKTIRYWVDSAAYDLETGKKLLEVKRFPYALFFGHLSIEKVLKALTVKATGEHAPHTHSLLFLAEKAALQIPDSLKDHLAECMEFHLESRYPDKNSAFYEKCTEEFTTRKFTELEDVYQWLLRKLEKQS